MRAARYAMKAARVRTGTWMQLYRTGLAGGRVFHIRPLFSHTSGGPTSEAASSLSDRKPSEGNLMFVKRHLGSLAAATGLGLAAFGVGGGANAADPFTLRFPTFKEGTRMAEQGGNKNPQNPKCGGD